MSNKKPAVDMNWLAEGREDQFANYLERAREDLAMADFSDDELANYAFMNYDRAPEAEAAEMMSRYRNGMLHQFHSRIAIMTAVKERLRWLSRRVAVLEGRYPGVPSPVIPTPRFTSIGEARAYLERSEGYAHPPHDQHSAYYDRPEYGSCFSVGGELTIDDMKAIIFIHEQENGTETGYPSLECSEVGITIGGQVVSIEDLPYPGDDTKVWVVRQGMVVWNKETEKYVSVHGVEDNKREMAYKQLEQDGDRLLVTNSVQRVFRQPIFKTPLTAQEAQWYKELNSFFKELAPGEVDMDGVIDKLITQTTVSWEIFCKGFSYNEQTGEPLSISYELKLENLFKFREEFRAGKFNRREE